LGCSTHLQARRRIRNLEIRFAMSSFAGPRAEYVQAAEPVSLRRLAEKWQIPASRLFYQSRIEGWVEQRRQFQGNGAAGAPQARPDSPSLPQPTAQDITARHSRYWFQIAETVFGLLPRAAEQQTHDMARSIEVIARALKVATEGERVAEGDGEDEREPKRVAIEWLFADTEREVSSPSMGEE
jgi:hypothetical protein